MPDKLLKKHSFCFNDYDNGGESLILHTEIYSNGDPKDYIYYNQELTLMSYSNSASLKLYGVSLTPELLRQLANELETAEAQGKALVERL